MNDTSLMNKKLSIFRTRLCILIMRENEQSNHDASISYSHSGLGG